MRKIKVGLLGWGTVGCGVARILLEKRELISARLGASLELAWIADVDLTRDRGIQVDPAILTTDAQKVATDPEVDIVVEMIGGVGAARDLILKAIDHGKQVVTANKALLATSGNSLFAAAARRGVDLAFEASVGGCMPVIKTLRESLIGNEIKGMTGILNGTCNYILSRITDEGISFKSALAQAQANGYAESDPTLDISGYDAAHKLAILTALAYGMEINFDDIYVEGISAITPLDIEFAEQFGFRIKLLAVSKNLGDKVEARVHPTMTQTHNLLSNVNGSLNAVTITGDYVEDLLLYGFGAGMLPTASAVVGDIADLARNLLTGSQGRVPAMSYRMEAIRPVPILPIEEIYTHYYIRFSALDRPGVLSRIAGVLGDYGISIKSVHQKGRQHKGKVPVVMLTHLAKEADVQNALRKIEATDIVGEKPVLIRIDDEDGD